MPFEIPFDQETGDSSFTEIVNLEGSEYVLEFDWNDRVGYWFFALRTEGGELIVSGKRVVTAWPLLKGVPATNRPPGELFAVDFFGEKEAPGFEDLGNRVGLFYYTAEELNG